MIRAYWLLPFGVGISVTTRHINLVVKNPQVFGETTNSCKETFKKYNEHMHSNVEGKARDEIIMRVLRRNFIRVRTNGTRTSQHWSIQAYKLTPALNQILWQWANHITGQMGSDKFADIKIHELADDNKIFTSLDLLVAYSTVSSDIKMYSEDEVHLLPQWNDCAHSIDPEGAAR